MAKREVDHLITLPETGYYVLTEDVVNPDPDKRSKRLARSERWKKGTLVKIKQMEEARFCTITFKDDSFVFAGEQVKGFPAAGTGILDKVIKAIPSLGQIIQDSVNRPSMILALLIDQNKLELKDVTRADAILEDMSREAYFGLERRHDL